MNERFPKPESLKSTTSICLACWLATLCIRVRDIRRIRKSSGCILHTCSQKCNEFEARTATLCTRVQRIPQMRCSDGSTLHTCSRNTMNSELKRLHFARLFKKYDDPVARPKHLALCKKYIPSSLGQKLSKSYNLSITAMY